MSEDPELIPRRRWPLRRRRCAVRCGPVLSGVGAGCAPRLLASLDDMSVWRGLTVTAVSVVIIVATSFARLAGSALTSPPACARMMSVLFSAIGIGDGGWFFERVDPLRVQPS